jgi:hypothetical protein
MLIISSHCTSCRDLLSCPPQKWKIPQLTVWVTQHMQIKHRDPWILRTPHPLNKRRFCCEFVHVSLLISAARTQLTRPTPLSETWIIASASLQLIPLSPASNATITHLEALRDAAFWALWAANLNMVVVLTNKTAEGGNANLVRVLEEASVRPLAKILLSTYLPLFTFILSTSSSCPQCYLFFRLSSPDLLYVLFCSH